MEFLPKTEKTCILKYTALSTNSAGKSGYTIVEKWNAVHPEGGETIWNGQTLFDIENAKKKNTVTY